MIKLNPEIAVLIRERLQIFYINIKKFRLPKE
jgi:hypothetical protein